MIVIDANILIYSLIECEYSPLVHKLREKDADWRTRSYACMKHSTCWQPIGGAKF